MNTNMKTSFWGKSLEVKALGYQNVKLKNTDEHFTIERPTSTVNNLIFGEMYIEHVGLMTVRNMKTQDYIEIDFKKRGWSNKGAFEFSGYCFNKYKDKKFKIHGKWNSFFDATNMESNITDTIWKANPDMPNFE